MNLLKRKMPTPVKRALKIFMRPQSVAILPAAVAYEEDGLATIHSAAFRSSSRFSHAYATGLSTKSWADISWRAHVIAWAADVASRLDGDFVECGVNRGGYARMVLDYVGSRMGSRSFYLLDTFKGLVPDQISAAEINNGIRDAYSYDNCFEEVKLTFSSFSNVVLVRGPVPATLTQVPSERIAFLSIDMNCASPEIAAAEYFWDRLVPGAMVVLDDYGHPLHQEQRLAFDDFARRHGVDILSLPTAQGVIIKPNDSFA